MDHDYNYNYCEIHNPTFILFYIPSYTITNILFIILCLYKLQGQGKYDTIAFAICYAKDFANLNTTLTL